MLPGRSQLGLQLGHSSYRSKFLCRLFGIHIDLGLGIMNLTPLLRKQDPKIKVCPQVPEREASPPHVREKGCLEIIRRMKETEQSRSSAHIQPLPKRIFWLLNDSTLVGGPGDFQPTTWTVLAVGDNLSGGSGAPRQGQMLQDSPVSSPFSQVAPILRTQGTLAHRI